MKRDAFQFDRVVVIARGENLFSSQLKEWGIPFNQFDSERPDDIVADQPDLILCINPKAGLADQYKSAYPEAQVAICRGGGTKAFASKVEIVHTSGQHDPHWFSGWDGFFDLIGHSIKPAPRPIVPAGGNAAGMFRINIPVSTDAGINPTLPQLYDSMLNASDEYLKWYLQWVREVEQMEFFCEFEFPRKRRSVKRVTVAIEGKYEHKGIPIVREDMRVTFYATNADEYPAIVKSVRETEITFVFDEALPRLVASSLASFQVEIPWKIAEVQSKLVTSLCHGLQVEGPLATMAGLASNASCAAHTELNLTKRQAEMLGQDQSQLAALLSMVSKRAITQIQGPAGTGKSFLTSVGVRQFVKKGKVVLLLSHSNQGLDNLVGFVADSIKGVDIFRLGNNESNITETGLKYHRTEQFAGADYKYDDRSLEEREAGHILELSNQGAGVILACTMSSFVVDETLELLKSYGLEIDVTFIDEASRGFLHELLPPIRATKERVVFVGDPDQLGNIDLSPAAKDEMMEYGVSPAAIECFADGWFNSTIKQDLFPVDLLRINRRSLTEINSIVSGLFYDDRLISGRFDPNDNGLVIFHDTSNAADCTEQHSGTSWKNGRESNLVVAYMVNQLATGKVSLADIGVITPYRAQIETIRGKLRKELLFNGKLTAWRDTFDENLEDNPEQLEEILHTVVNTVDAFQGSQRKIIILSMVRTNKSGEIGFNENINRLRVAFSRAQNRLVVFASADTFLRSDAPRVNQIFTTLIASARRLTAYAQVA